MPATNRVPQPFLQPVDGSGNPYPGGLLYFYLTGTTTPSNTYSDTAQTVPNTNPVVADGSGMFPVIYLASGVTYDAVLKNSSGSTIWTATAIASGTVSAASTTVAGTVELATQTEAVIGTDTARAMTPQDTASAIQQGFSYGTTSGTANAIIVTPTVTPFSLAGGTVCYFKATSSNSSGTTLDYGGVGAITVKVATTSGLTACVGGEIVTGNTYRCTYSAVDSAWILELVGFTPSTISLFVALPGATGLVITNGGATTNISITYDQVVIVDSNGRGIASLAGSFTCDCSSNGALNKLDTGSIAATSEYHIFIIAKPDGTGVGSLASLSATAPTLPTGYSGGFKYRIGCMITGGASTFLRTKQIGRKVQYVVTAGSTTTFMTRLTIANVGATLTAIQVQGSTGSGNAKNIPSTASAISIVVWEGGFNNQRLMIFPSNDGGWVDASQTRFFGGTSMGAGTFTETQTLTEFQLESTSLYYTSTAAGGATNGIWVWGWTDKVNA
jgi:hypothetical protein